MDATANFDHLEPVEIRGDFETKYLGMMLHLGLTSHTFPASSGK